MSCHVNENYLTLQNFIKKNEINNRIAEIEKKRKDKKFWSEQHNFMSIKK